MYENLEGTTIGGIQLTLNYKQADPTNASATPEIRRITVRNVHIRTSSSDGDSDGLLCDGLNDSVIEDIVFDNVTITGNTKQKCEQCAIKAINGCSPQPKCSSSGGTWAAAAW